MLVMTPFGLVQTLDLFNSAFKKPLLERLDRRVLCGHFRPFTNAAMKKARAFSPAPLAISHGGALP
jgi:hypothetical protein